jgi:hypothetical protein
MGWRGTLRSIVAAQRAAEREEQHRQKLLDKAAKLQERLGALQEAAVAAAEYEHHIRRLTTLHHECGKVWDWAAYANAAAPEQPKPSTTKQQAAQAAIDAYSPGFFDSLFGRVERRRTELTEKLRRAINDDAGDNKHALRLYKDLLRTWEEQRDLALRILARDSGALLEALEEIGPFNEIAALGSRVSFRVGDDGRVDVDLHVNAESVIPRESVTLLQSGKISTKRLPESRFLELYQDYVVGAVLRIARELFALLPVETVFVTAFANLVDTSTGAMADQPILCVEMPRSTLDGFRFDSLDPSDSLKNFRHVMDFKKTKGFRPIEPLTESCVAS